MEKEELELLKEISRKLDILVDVHREMREVKVRINEMSK